MRTVVDLRSRLGDERGLTLVELLVVTVLMGIVGSIIFASVLGMTRAVAIADRTSFDQGFGRNAITLLSRDIRAAAAIQQSSDPAFVFAGPRSLDFTANLSTQQQSTLIGVEVDAADQIVVSATEPEPTSEAPDLVFDPADAADRYIASYVVNTGPLFRFFDEDGVELDQFVVAGGLSATDRARIATVEVTLDLNREPDQTGSTRLTTTVRLPNAGARD